MNMNETEFKGLCVSLDTAFPRFVEYMKVRLEKDIFNKSDDKIKELKIKYAFLNELEATIKNEGTY